MSVVRRPFSLQLEDDHAAVVPSGEQVLLRVRRQDPEAVIFATEGLHTHALADVPHLEPKGSQKEDEGAKRGNTGREAGDQKAVSVLALIIFQGSAFPHYLAFVRVTPSSRCHPTSRAGLRQHFSEKDDIYSWTKSSSADRRSRQERGKKRKKTKHDCVQKR